MRDDAVLHTWYPSLPFLCKPSSVDRYQPGTRSHRFFALIRGHIHRNTHKAHKNTHAHIYTCIHKDTCTLMYTGGCSKIYRYTCVQSQTKRAGMLDQSRGLPHNQRRLTASEVTAIALRECESTVIGHCGHVCRSLLSSTFGERTFLSGGDGGRIVRVRAVSVCHCKRLQRLDHQDSIKGKEKKHRK